ncbi:protein N-terminal asparagine amidohydrolase isoform X6 [Ursus arctos]|uniref:protein N-terminal asparagine amidohydrolase isoform X6 n=1 Tax=Ursus arctos TaxID=9644 RepID=UPI0020178AD3|nr:protein N-terminal asparagine amidohydrolase isoform X6 [Ursus arctos]
MSGGSISILGSDDATTCHIVVLRHTGNGATCLTHCDGTDTRAEVPLIMSSIRSFSEHAQCGRLEVHLVGGFSDDRQLSQKLTHQLLSEFDRQEEDIHLVTLCVTELNDREENENHFPIIYGIAVNIKTAEIYRASFPDRGPEEELRAARALTGGPMISIYDAKTEQLRIGPYSWMPFPHVDFWLQQDDKQILERTVPWKPGPALQKERRWLMGKDLFSRKLNPGSPKTATCWPDRDRGGCTERASDFTSAEA